MSADRDRPRPPLNQHQRRHFEVLLSTLEEALARVESLAAPSVVSPGTLRRYENDLPAGFAQGIQPLLEAARTRIQQLAADLELQPRVVSRARSIRALLTAEVVRIEDSGAANLRGYGTVDPRVAQEIEPVLDELRATLLSIARRLERSAAPSTGSDPKS